jgi:hypothetical protein
VRAAKAAGGRGVGGGGARERGAPLTAPP